MGNELRLQEFRLSPEQPIVGDGSAYFTLQGKTLARAGSALAQVMADGNMHKALFQSVPGQQPQTAASAEHNDISPATRFALITGFTLYLDCKG